MKKRDFDTWLNTFKKSISTYSYYVDFRKVYKNVEEIKVELNILNSLIGSKNIKSDFEKILLKYPDTIKCVPILLAVRTSEIDITEEKENIIFNFSSLSHTIVEYSMFMEKSGLFDLLSNHLISNLLDYVTGVETGLDSNGRKNRGGELMEDLVEQYITETGSQKDISYFRQINISKINTKWNVDLSSISNKGKLEKVFDFAVKTKKTLFLIETNFYKNGGSKLNETARSYKNLANEIKNIPGVEFVWLTDGEGWFSARKNLQDTFDAMEHLYCIKDMENGVLKKLFK